MQGQAGALYATPHTQAGVIATKETCSSWPGMATAWLWGGRSLDLEEWQLPLGRQEIQQGSELPVAASVQALLSSGSAPCPCQKHLRCPQWSCRACSTSCGSSMSGWAYSVPACALLQQPRYKNNVSVSFQCRAHTACLFVSILAAGIGYCTAEALWLPQNYVGNAPTCHQNSHVPSSRGVGAAKVLRKDCFVNMTCMSP